MKKEEAKILYYFIKRKAISDAPNIRGNNQFPNPSIIIITKKKIIIKEWAETFVLKI